jgi:hypothetical protein
MVLVLIKVHEEAHLILAEPLHGQLDAAHPGVVGVPALLLQIASNCVFHLRPTRCCRQLSAPGVPVL